MCKKSRTVDLRGSRHGSGVQTQPEGLLGDWPRVERSDTLGFVSTLFVAPRQGVRGPFRPANKRQCGAAAGAVHTARSAARSISFPRR